MIEVIVDFNAKSFVDSVRKLINEGYKLKGAEVAKNPSYPDYPFLYTALLIKQL